LRGAAVVDYNITKLKFSAKHFLGAVERMVCAAKKGCGRDRVFYLTTLSVAKFMQLHL
jgi:hypothetical protein